MTTKLSDIAQVLTEVKPRYVCWALNPSDMTYPQMRQFSAIDLQAAFDAFCLRWQGNKPRTEAFFVNAEDRQNSLIIWLNELLEAGQ